MKKLALLALAGVTSAVACGGGDDTTAGTGEVVPGDIQNILNLLPGDAAQGEITYGQTCGSTSCHGPNGNDGDPNAGDLTQDVAGLSDAQLATTIKNGTGDMIPVAITNPEIANVMTYCRNTFE